MVNFNQHAILAQDALNRLEEGHSRFLRGECSSNKMPRNTENELLKKHQPIATILCCSDSRVPVDIILDQPLGSLFVVRVPGNIAESVQISSIEFSVSHLGSPLVLVFGHSHCAGVQAAIDCVVGKKDNVPQSLLPIAEEIIPAVRKLALSRDYGEQEQRFAEDAVKVNVENTMEKLLSSHTIRTAVQSGNVLIRGAVVSLETLDIKYL